MICPTCGRIHKTDHPHIKAKVEKELEAEGFPTASKRYQYAHEQANKAEKAKFGSTQYNQLKKMVRGIQNTNQLLGKNTKTGKIEISQKVPPKYRPEVAFHEKYENNILRHKK